jgi:hypothetical protein
MEMEKVPSQYNNTGKSLKFENKSLLYIENTRVARVGRGSLVNEK